MKIKIAENSIRKEEIQSILEMQFPNYKVIKRKKRVLVIKKSKIAGCDVIFRKKSIHIIRNFPSKGSNFLFYLSIFLLGVILPIIVFYSVFYKKQKRVEKEIGNFLKNELAHITPTE